MAEAPAEEVQSDDPVPAAEATAPVATATATQGCLGVVDLVVTIPELAAGTPVTVVVSGVDRIATTAGAGGRVAVELTGLPQERVQLDVAVLVADMVFPATVTTTSGCTAAVTVTLSRDCATPDAVLATVEATGLTGGVHRVLVQGASGDRDVRLTSGDIQVSGGRFTGALPLTSLTGPVPPGVLTGVVLVLDDGSRAVALGNAVLAACPAPEPVAAPAAAPGPAAPGPAAPGPVAQPTGNAPGHVDPVMATGGPAELARTGTPTTGLLLLAGVFLVIGRLASVAGRRPGR